jgi:class 3 adenylate cyclase/pimeloyl-ACP methyl ester carboxylesterase
VSDFAQVIWFDMPGTGASDPVDLENLPALERWPDSMLSVMDTAGVERAALISYDTGALAAIVTAATHPERVSALILMSGCAKMIQGDGYPYGQDPSAADDLREAFVAMWGTGRFQTLANPDLQWNEGRQALWARVERLGASPKVVRAMAKLVQHADVRAVLPAIRVPTLVMHRKDDRLIPVEHAEYLAAHIPDAKLVVFPGRDHYPFVGDIEPFIGEMREFLTGQRSEMVDDRMLATVLFTDIVDSTKHAAKLGDSRWRSLLDAHDTVVRGQLSRFRGREVKTVGDGFLATFDGPQRAIRCAMGIREAVRSLGIDVRAGLHTGECEIRGEDVGGIAVHIGARVSALAGAGEVLVSQTVKDLTIGSGLAFEDRGLHGLKGVPGEWKLFAVAG